MIIWDTPEGRVIYSIFEKGRALRQSPYYIWFLPETEKMPTENHLNFSTEQVRNYPFCTLPLTMIFYECQEAEINTMNHGFLFFV